MRLRVRTGAVISLVLALCGADCLAQSEAQMRKMIKEEFNKASNKAIQKELSKKGVSAKEAGLAVQPEDPDSAPVWQMTVADVTGHLYVKAAGRSKWAAVQPGLPLASGDRLKTGLEEGAVLLLDNTGGIVLEPETELAVDALSYEESYFTLESGAVVLKISSVASRGRRLLVRTSSLELDALTGGLAVSCDAGGDKSFAAALEGGDGTASAVVDGKASGEGVQLQSGMEAVAVPGGQIKTRKVKVLAALSQSLEDITSALQEQSVAYRRLGASEKKTLRAAAFKTKAASSAAKKSGKKRSRDVTSDGLPKLKTYDNGRSSRKGGESEEQPQNDSGGVFGKNSINFGNDNTHRGR